MIILRNTRMKKAFLAALLIAAMLFTGCATPSPITPEATKEPFSVQDAEITESSHPREDGFKNPFKTRMIDTPYASVHMEAGENYSDESLRAFAGAVYNDILSVAAFTGETPRKITLYAAGNIQRDRAILLGDHIICEISDAESRAYREALIGACYDIPITWVQVGLAENVFGSPDASGLAEYYRDEAHALTASCAAVYFISGVADDETVKAARATAADLAAFVLETEGFSALKAIESPARVLPAWAKKLGIEAPVLPDGNEKAAVMTGFKDRIPGRVCVMRFNNITMNVSKGGFAQTADELYAFACRFFVGADIVLAQIEEEAPFLYELASEHYSSPFTINFVDDPTNNGISTAWGDDIDLRYQAPAWHELVHWLLFGTPWNWLHEAAAEHFSYRAMSVALEASFDEEEQRAYFDDPELSDEDRAFFDRVLTLYAAERGSEIPSGLLDYGAYRRSIAICSLLLEYDPLGVDYSIAGVAGRKSEEKATDPGALSYYEAAVFLDYLIDTYGAENVLSYFLNGGSPEDACGKPYPELFGDFMDYLRESYPQLVTISD